MAAMLQLANNNAVANEPIIARLLKSTGNMNQSELMLEYQCAREAEQRGTPNRSGV